MPPKAGGQLARPAAGTDLAAAAGVFRERAAGKGKGNQKKAKDQFQVLLVGQRGAGKTAFLGLLRGLSGVTDSKPSPAQISQLQKVGGSSNAYARSTKAELAEVSAASGDRPPSYSVLDVPGWEDTSGTNQEDSRDKEHGKFFKEAARNAKYIDAVVLVVNGTLARSQASIEHSLQTLGELYPIEEIRDRVVVLFTFCDSQQKCVYPIQSLRTYLGRQDPPLFYVDNPLGRLSGMTAKELDEQLQEDSPDDAGAEIRREVKKGVQAAAALLEHISKTNEPTRLKASAAPTCSREKIGAGAALVAVAMLATYVLAPCNVKNAQGFGFQCACNIAYSGSISWEVISRSGSCQPAVCNIENSDKQHGLSCSCLGGFSGDITWSASKPSGTCTPLPCHIQSSNQQHGPACACADGFGGNITWSSASSSSASTPSGTCTPAPCNISHSNMEDGESCECLSGYSGDITWSASTPVGSCVNATISGASPALLLRYP